MLGGDNMQIIKYIPMIFERFKNINSVSKKIILGGWIASITLLLSALYTLSLATMSDNLHYWNQYGYFMAKNSCTLLAECLAGGLLLDCFIAKR